MIEQAVFQHLMEQESLASRLTTFDREPAIFNQEAPSDTDPLWDQVCQYPRVVFSVDLQGNPERCMGGTLVVDVMCHEDEPPEEIEPIIRELIHGYFFSKDTFTVSAQWKTSSYFTQPTDEITGCTISFDLLGFPVLTTDSPDVIRRINEWTRNSFGRHLHVINHDHMPFDAWKPIGNEAAVYWRLVTDNPAGWIPDTFQTIWRTATIRCHVFAEDVSVAATVGRHLIAKLYTDKRLLKEEETPIMVNQKNSQDNSADPLRTGQVTVEATYAIIVHFENSDTIDHINTSEEESHGEE